MLETKNISKRKPWYYISSFFVWFQNIQSRNVIAKSNVRPSGIGIDQKRIIY